MAHYILFIFKHAMYGLENGTYVQVLYRCTCMFIIHKVVKFEFPTTLEEEDLQAKPKE